MPTLEDLGAAHRQFAAVLAAVSPQDWQRRTPCEDWSVHDLVEHLVVGEHMALDLLDGATTEEALANRNELDEAAASEQYAALASASEVAFAAPGALERTVHHFVGDVSGEQLLGFRVVDHTLHAWDLGRAIGRDEPLDPALVESVWAALAPIAPFIGSVGMFGSGPSGDVAEDAALELRLLDLAGRRP